MAKINTNSLAGDLAQRIASLNSGSSVEDYLYTAVAARGLDRRNTVATVNDLPNLAVGPMPDGIIVFVESLGVLVISAQSQWVGLDGRLVRNDLTMSAPAWSWGYNGQGQLGDGTTCGKCSPVTVAGGFVDWCQAAGASHSLALRTNGTLWAWGFSGAGRLGDGTTINRTSPVSVIGGIADWCAVAAGFHSLAIRTNGTAWAWGSNGSGQLGDGTVTNRSSPVSVVGGFTNWCAIAANNYHSLAIRTNGTAWAWGSNTYGRLGDGTVTDRSSPVSVIGGITDWCAIAAGSNHSLGLRTNGTAWSWGRNSYGRLGDGTVTDRSSPVSVIGGIADWCVIDAGGCHSVAIRTNGTAWSWGSNGQGQLGDGTVTTQSSPVSVVGGITDWCAIAAGRYHSAAIRTNGTAWSWGGNSSGQLGHNTATTCPRSSPVSVIGGFTDWCAVSSGYRFSLAIRNPA